MTLRHLQIFVEVAVCGKMSLAASHLFISQPTVSQSIAELEKYYQTKLFERYPRGLYLTEAGKLLLQNAKDVLAAYHKLNDTMLSSMQTLPVHVGATVTIGDCVIHKILRQFRESYPSADLRIYVNNTHAIEEKLLNAELDIALVEGNVQSSDLISEPVIRDFLVLVCGKDHPFSKRQEVSLGEIAAEPFILREQGSGTRSLFENFMSERGYTLDIRWECTNAGTIKRAVMNHLGLSVISIRLVEEEIRAGAIRVVPVKGGVWNRSFSLVRHKYKYLSPDMEQFIETVKAYEDSDILELLPSLIH
ncbi:LysR family transcriptional regulator [Cuneatibacter sp. NSJ-177]|uniref:LysR family transcriptional regulator n=1 Tax=Cuneatibacter sp. NSJ-177 TaxID=2931401 RepID=UPI001FD40D9B|nr:LysR family transcriptional regulator [Cuneatibacter sp. NSJ-177]MCJ7835520.1 LysR family transcriptional regulator [Cuneatibacter sp. NSJ-177]